MCKMIVEGILLMFLRVLAREGRPRLPPLYMPYGHFKSGQSAALDSIPNKGQTKVEHACLSDLPA